MSLASIIISAATKEFAGFSVIGYLTEKAADVGTGKIWTELKKKISDKPDSFECRLYGAIEKSVGEYLCKETGEDVSAAICECIFDVWCLEGYLTPEQIANILYRYSAYAKQNDILEWYRTFQNQIIKDNVLYPMFMMNNIQLSGKLQREQDKKIDQVLALLQAVMKENKETQQKKPEYISDPPTDIDSFYVDRTMLENELWTAFILAGKSALLYGMGGIGKTEMAKAVLKKIYSLPCDVTGIYQIAWVTYTNGKLKDSLIEAFYDTKGYTDRDEAWEHVYNRIQTQREKLLIVIDNVEMIEQDRDIERVGDLPCRILVTSRTEKIGGLYRCSVDHLPEEDCRDIFYHYYVGNHDNHYLDKILRLIEYHTVMLELLAKTANMEEKTLQEFYELLVQKGFRMSNEEVDSHHPLLQSEKRVTEQLKILFTISKCRIQDKDLLCQLSVIPAIPFQYKAVRNWIEIQHKSQLEYLVKTGWLKSDGKLVSTYIMHSVIASAIRFQNEECLYEKCRYVIHSITKEMECKEQEHGSEKSYLIPFSWSISDVLRDHLCDEQDAEFLTNLAYVYYDIGNYDNAYQFFQRALEIDERVTGPDSITVSSDYYNLADVSYNMYQFSKSLLYLRKALAIRKKHYSSDDIGVVVLIKLLAGIYVKLNRPDRAEALYSWAADKFERNPKTDILQLSTLYSDMASFFRERGYPGDYEKAKIYYQKTEPGMKQIYGDKPHPEMAAFYDEYALLYDNMGKYSEALSLLQKALEIKQKTLKKEHPDIVQSYGSIGLIYYELTEYDKALDYLNEALEIADKIWSGPFSFKSDIYNNLGLVYRSKGDYQKAEELYGRALRIREEIYTPDHPMVLATKNNIAQVYASEERYSEAISLFETVIRKYRGNSTEDSVFLATIYDNLSTAYREMERYNDAIDICTKGLNIRKNIYGKKSLDYAISLNNLALIYYEMGALNDAADIFSEAVTIKKETLPEIHGQISIGYFNLGLVYDKLHRDNEALENYRASMEIDNELGAYGDVLLTAEYVAEIYERNDMPEEAEAYRTLCSEDDEH